MSENWIVKMSNSRKLPYFYNQVTSESVWQTPEGLTEEQVAALPGAELLRATADPDAAAAGTDGQNAQAAGNSKPATQIDPNMKIRALHILIKHRGSRRPSSHRSNNITRSLEEAREQLAEIQKSLNENLTQERFQKYAESVSDCSSAAKGGDLGRFGLGQMQKPFEEAAFALEPKQMSGIVETDSGVHLIMRIE